MLRLFFAFLYTNTYIYQYLPTYIYWYVHRSWTWLDPIHQVYIMYKKYTTSEIVIIIIYYRFHYPYYCTISLLRGPLLAMAVYNSALPMCLFIVYTTYVYNIIIYTYNMTSIVGVCETWWLSNSGQIPILYVANLNRCIVYLWNILKFTYISVYGVCTIYYIHIMVYLSVENVKKLAQTILARLLVAPVQIYGVGIYEYNILYI